MIPSALAPSKAVIWGQIALRLLIGGVLFYAGFAKAIGSTAEFAAVIQTYQILPATWATPVAMAIPWLEMWIGTFVIFGYAGKLAAYGAAALFVMFLGALGSALARHIDLVSCGCFGAEAMSPRQTLAMDSILLILTVFLIFLSRSPSPYTVDNWLDK